MGQGLHIKMLQVTNSTLNIPISFIFTSETSTDKVPNTTHNYDQLGIRSERNGRVGI